jgi:hypothetical protein
MANNLKRKPASERATTRYGWDGVPKRAVTLFIPFTQCDAAEKRIGKDRRGNGRPCGSLKAVCEAILERVEMKPKLESHRHFR